MIICIHSYFEIISNLFRNMKINSSKHSKYEKCKIGNVKYISKTI